MISLSYPGWFGGRADADPLLRGFDYLATPPGGAIFNPSRYGLGPNVDIPMQGRSLLPGSNIDTIIQRKTDLPGALGLGPIDAEIIGLSLESMAPVSFGSSFFDVFVDLNPEIASNGTVTITSHTPGPLGGGTYNSQFTIYARATLTEVGNPLNQLVFNIQDTITSTASPWSHIPPAGYPGAAGFVPGPTVHTGPHPQTNPATGPLLVTNPITRGYDFFFTPPGTGTFVDLTPFGLGVVPLEGVALPNIAPGPVDTVVARKAMGPLEGAPPDAIPIELVALHLKSSTPVDLTPVGGPPVADLHITVDAGNPDLFNLPVPVPVPPSSGQMEIVNFPGIAGGTFRACFGNEPGCDSSLFGAGLGVPGGGVHSNAIFVIPGGDPANPADVIHTMQAPSIVLSSFGQFDHGGTNRAGNFDITVVSHNGPHPAHVDRISVFVDPPESEADFNSDGIIDAADYVAWLKTDGSPVGYAAWHRDFGMMVLSGSGAHVPEPAAAALWAVAALAGGVYRRRISRP